jgi:hypothetical protein
VYLVRILKTSCFSGILTLNEKSILVLRLVYYKKDQCIYRKVPVYCL